MRNRVTTFKLLANGIALLILVCQILSGYAQEPVNLALAKQAIIKYHDSGEYEKDIQSVIDKAIVYIRTVSSAIKKPAIVFDIDETSLSNFSAMRELNFGGTLQEIQRKETLGNDPAIKPTLRLYQYAKSLNIAIFFVSGRPEYERNATIKNLQSAGYVKWNGLFLKPTTDKKISVALFKTGIRRQLAAQGYKILVNIGDQASDLAGGYAMQVYKLPNPFYLIK